MRPFSPRIARCAFPVQSSPLTRSIQSAPGVCAIQKMVLLAATGAEAARGCSLPCERLRGREAGEEHAREQREWNYG
jgi:hypothetical protein